MDLKTLTPRVTGDRVLVRQDEPKTQTASGLHIPDVAGRDWPPIGTVVAVGPKNKDVVPGDRVLFARRPSSALVQDDRTPDQPEDWKGLVRLYAEDILALVDE